MNLSLSQRWREQSITAKFVTTFGLLLALIVLVAATGYVALTVVRRQTESSILTSTEIQRLVLEMDGGLETARRLQRDFFLRYPEIGFAEARDTYALHAIQQIAHVVTLSAELKECIAQSHVSDALRERDVDLNLYLSSAERYADTFLDTVEMITILAAEDTGLQARLARHSMGLYNILEAADDPALITRYREMQSFEKDYLVTRQRPFLQSALNVSFSLRGDIIDSPALTADQEAQALTHLDSYLTTAEAIADLDVDIRAKFHDFDLQAESVDPISAELLALANTEVAQARVRIERTSRLAAGILVATFVVGLAAALLVAWMLNQSVTRNVVKLTHAAQELRRGNLDVSAQVNSSDELGQLAAAFNAMAAEIKTQIAELNELNQTLQASERRYRRLFEESHDSISITTPDGRFVDINPAGERLFGYTRAELMERNAQTFYRHSQDRTTFRRMLEQSGTVENFETQLCGRDGAVRDVLISATVQRSDHGTIQGFQAVIHDITERKQSEQEREHLQERLIQAQKMEAVGRLAGGIAHDFNNVLTAIQGYGHILFGDIASDDPQDWPTAQSLRADLGEILASANRAAALTQQLLAFSRKQVLQPRLLNLNDLLHSMENMLRRLIGEDIDLLLVLAPDLGHVRADPGQIEQVMMNLSVNARDAMPHGGKLTFETANVELGKAYGQTHPNVDPGWYVLLAVSDTGVGMSDEVKAHLFEPFFTTKERGRGTGLGLATVYGIIEQSGGHTEVYSELGMGATFKMYLPLADSKTGLIEPERAAKDMPSGTETVLVVEDEQPVRDLVSRVLGRCGYTVLAAGRPQEAVALSQEYAGHIHLLVTDVVMPEMGGKDLAERLVSLRPQMKVLYISGYTDNAITRHGVLDPGVSLLEKPFTPDGFARKVREVLDAS